MEIDKDYLKRFKVEKPKSDSKHWERADAVLEATRFLHFAEVYQMTIHLEPHEIVYLIDRAKKEGEKPKSFYRHLVNEHRNNKKQNTQEPH